YKQIGLNQGRNGRDNFIENVHYIVRAYCKLRRILLFSVEMLFHERLTVPGTSLRFFYFLSFYFFLSLFSTSCALLPLDAIPACSSLACSESSLDSFANSLAALICASLGACFSLCLSRECFAVRRLWFEPLLLSVTPVC